MFCGSWNGKNMVRGCCQLRGRWYDGDRENVWIANVGNTMKPAYVSRTSLPNISP